MTYQEIARRAGVSTATVSRVLSGAGRVSEERRQRVLDVVEQMSYRSNRAARTLRRQRADTIGLILSDIEYPFCATIARSVEGAASEHGFGVFVCSTDENLDREQFYVDLMIEERVSGVIVSPALEGGGTLSVLTDAGIPVVTVDRLDPSGLHDAVLLDNASATEALAEDLLSHGHRRFAALVGTTAATSSRERLTALRQALETVPGTELRVEEGHLRETVGVERTMRTIGEHALRLVESSTDRPTAIVCANAVMVMGVIDALMDAGISIPDDVAVVGYDDVPAFKRYATPVTVAGQPTEAIGANAAALLFDRIHSPKRPAQVLRMPPQMHFRNSCGHGHPSLDGRLLQGEVKR